MATETKMERKREQNESVTTYTARLLERAEGEPEEQKTKKDVKISLCEKKNEEITINKREHTKNNRGKKEERKKAREK